MLPRWPFRGFADNTESHVPLRLGSDSDASTHLLWRGFWNGGTPTFSKIGVPEMLRFQGQTGHEAKIMASVCRVWPRFMRRLREHSASFIITAIPQGVWVDDS